MLSLAVGTVSSVTQYILPRLHELLRPYSPLGTFGYILICNIITVAIVLGASWIWHLAHVPAVLHRRLRRQSESKDTKICSLTAALEQARAAAQRRSPVEEEHFRIAEEAFTAMSEDGKRVLRFMWENGEIMLRPAYPETGPSIPGIDRQALKSLLDGELLTVPSALARMCPAVLG